MPEIESFIRLMKNPVKSRLFLFFNLPSAYFSGVRLNALSETTCSVIIPYKWFSKNPFRSTYFACLAMAAEMSTGVLSLMHVYKRNPAVSMLVVKLEAQYFKKATGITTFTCEQGDRIRDTIETAISTGNPQTLTARSLGLNASGEQVAEFLITWSYKRKS